MPGEWKGTPMTQALEEEGIAFFLLSLLATFSSSLNKWSLAGQFMPQQLN